MNPQQWNVLLIERLERQEESDPMGYAPKLTPERRARKHVVSIGHKNEKNVWVCSMCEWEMYKTIMATGKFNQEEANELANDLMRSVSRSYVRVERGRLPDITIPDHDHEWTNMEPS